MRTIVALLTLISLNAVDQIKEPWQRWVDKPAKAPLWLSVNATGSSAGTLQVADETYNISIIDCDTLGDTNTFIPSLRPHTEYTLTVSGSALKSVQIAFRSFDARSLRKGRGTLGVPHPFKIFIDGREHSEEFLLTHELETCGSFSKSWKIELRPDRGLRPVTLAGYEEQWRRDEDNIAQWAPGDGFTLELGPGLSTNSTQAGIRWAVGMGRLWNGNTVGMIRLNELALSSNIYTAKPLSFTVRSTNTTELDVVTNAFGQLRQIRAPQALSDIQATNGECALKFYLLSHVASSKGTNGLYAINTNTPFVVWRIKNPDGVGSGTRLQLIEERPGRTNTSQIAYNSTNTTWTLTRGAAAETITESRAITFTNSNRIETTLISQGGTNYYKAIEWYHPYTWGWELTNVISGIGSVLQTNWFDFYTDTNDVSAFGKVRIKFGPTGNYEKYLYTNRFQRVLRPFQDTPADPYVASITNTIYTRLDPEAGGMGAHGDVYVDEFYGPAGELVSNDNGDDSIAPFGGNHSYAYQEWILPPNENGYHFELKFTGYMYNQVYSHEKPGNHLDGCPYEERYPERDALHDYTEYALCSYTPGSYSYTTNSSGPGFVKRLWKGAAAGDLPTTPWQGTNWAALDGSIRKGTAETTVFNNGNVALETVDVITNALEGEIPYVQTTLISRYVNAYDSLGHLTNRVFVDPANTNIQRTVYSASWNLGSGDCELQAFEIDETGIKTTFAYDSLKRVTNAVRIGVTNAGFPAQVSISTNFTYNALGQLLGETISAAALTRSRSAQYDVLGRPTAIVGLDGITTNVTYSANGRSVTNTMPGGVTRITQNYIDGRLKSVTGTAQVAEYYNYSVLITDENDSWIWEDYALPKHTTEIRYGSTNSARWKKTILDQSRNLTYEMQPAGDGTISTNLFVHWVSPNGRLYYVDKDAVARDGTRSTHRTLFYYDDYFGTNYVETYRMSDLFARVDFSDVSYQMEGTNWFFVSTNYFGVDYPYSYTNTTQQRLTGFSSSSIASEVYQYDVFGNKTTTTVSIDRANKRVNEITQIPQSVLRGTNIALNGLLQHSSTPTVSTPTRYFYDALGREVQVTDPLGFSVSQTYDTYGHVLTQTDKTGAVTTYAYYTPSEQNAGQVYSIINPAGKHTRFKYDTRGHMTHTWGDVPYPELRLYDSALGDMIELRTFQGGTDWTLTSLPTGFSGTSNSTKWFYDAGTGLVTNKTDALTNSVSYTYYCDNQVKTRRWARGVVTTNWYDEFGWLVGKSYSDGTTAVTNQNFNNFGMPRTVVDSSGTRYLTYDIGGRLLTEEIGLIRLQNDYSALRGLTNRAVLTNDLWGSYIPLFNHHYSYDFFGRLSSVSNGPARISYAYMPTSDLVQTITYKSNTTAILTTTKDWEFSERLRAISHSTGGASFQSFFYGYDSRQRRIRSIWQDGSEWMYDYDDRDQVISGKRYWYDSVPVAGQQFEYNYDSIGNRTRQLAGGDIMGANLRTTTYTNNAINALAGLGTPGSLDVAGMAYATATATVNTGNTSRKGEYYRSDLAVANSGGPVAQQVTNSAALSGNTTTVTGQLLVAKASSILNYDRDGNLTNDSLWHYKWDAENRLTEMTNATALASAARKKLTFTYDDMGRRVSKQVYLWGSTNWNAAPALSLKFIYSDWLLVAETSTNDVPLRSYTWGLDLSGTFDGSAGTGGLLNTTHYGATNSTNFFVAFDGNGNVTSLTDFNKSQPAVYEYSPFGELLRASGSIAKTHPLRFSTKFQDDETQLNFYGYRYYSSSLGRWISRDPIQEAGGLNLFAAMQNSPVTLYDADGRWSIPPRLKKLFYVLGAAFLTVTAANDVPGRVESSRRAALELAQEEQRRLGLKPGKPGGTGGVGGPPKNFYRHSGAVWSMALIALQATYSSIQAAVNLVSGVRSAEGSADYALESALFEYNRGENAMGDLAAIESALISTGGVGSDALIGYFVFSSLGEAFSGL